MTLSVDIAIKILLNVTKVQNFNKYLVKRQMYEAQESSIRNRLTPLLEPLVLV